MQGHDFPSTLSGQYHDPNQWEHLADWLHATADRYGAILKDSFNPNPDSDRSV
ncbi:hypothetical protein PN441_15020 [Spirulina major CS-329]|uniref:hypothetical protein n=1 Tax=Spirulina TaxID=1154 RepID=UPI00232CB672|nr:MULTISPECIES: hypothetical protein [Spirulina]MDB9494789.1 hypothetical protein [Spirulina subsalsa CS-330]MDB9504388.1 hypothetical protein [Spirulina major CS-329]